MERLPYIDLLLQELKADAPETLASLGTHIHLGYWAHPALADGSFENFAAAAERLAWMVCEAGSARDGQRILDVGCGIGGTVESLNKRLSGVDLCGVNIDTRQLEVAKETVVARSGNKVQFVAGDACPSPTGLLMLSRRSSAVSTFQAVGSLCVKPGECFAPAGCCRSRTW